MSSPDEIKNFFEAVKEDASWADINERELKRRAEEGLFIFKPSEFVIVEEMEYDETIQRPEGIRFYTLDQQINDAYEKMIPKGRTTKFQLQELKKEVDRLRQLYLDNIVPAADKYLLREPEYGKRFSWIRPVYAESEVAPYSYETSWIPLFSEERVRLPNFYRTMLTALPRPYVGGGEGTPYPLTEATEFVNASYGNQPFRALPAFTFPRTQRHEDGRFDVLPVPLANTEDVVNFVGYYAAKRPVPVPNPLPEHPFLKSSAATMIESTAPLSEVVPSLDAIMTHAVPVTQDPYGEGMKYLRVYDIQLTDIPWTSWKSRFPPVETAIPQEPIGIEFPTASGDAPSSKLMDYYSSYFPAMSARQWLMDQLDGGELVVQMLMSQAGQNGTVAMSPGADGDFEFPKTTIAECELQGLDFHDFSIRGVLRRTWKIVKDKDVISYQCVPLELIKQERAREGHRKRMQWTETTHDTILESYVRAVVGAKPMKMVTTEVKYESKPAREISQLRHEVVVLLNDEQRLPEDKVRDITEIVKEATLSDSVFVDSKGLFLVCLHTISILMGDLAEDRRTFYDNWTSRVDGFRVCKFCGEHVNSDVLENQEEFTDEGRVLRHADVLESKHFDGHGAMDQVKTLSQMRDLFDFSKPSDEVFFMLISLLYVVPEVDQLLPILTMGRTLAAQLQQAKRDGGVVGITQAILMIQAHVPPLIPRRSFSSKPLTLRGYPRDAPTAEGYTIVDSMLLVLTKTLEAYPTSFKGSSAITMRAVLNKPADVKKVVITTIGLLLKQSEPLRLAMDRAKAVLPSEEPSKPSNMIPGNLAMPTKEAFGQVTGVPPCPTSRVYWTNVRPPRVKQPSVALTGLIDHFESRESIKKIIGRAISQRTTPVPVDVKSKEVGARLKMGKDKEASEDWHTNVLLATRIGSIFGTPAPVRTLDPSQKSDDLRDITKGYLFELVKEIGKDPVKKTKLTSMQEDDVTLKMLTADVSKAKQATNTLKAMERGEYTRRLRNMTDPDREITKDLIDRGLAPYIITPKDRLVFARELAQREREAEEADTGVGTRTIDDDDLGGLPMTEDQRVRGNYGDYSGSNAADGNDAEMKEPNQFEEDD